ncbi:MAG: extensin family protein [Polyangiaceae bacterium]|nr:extensin family protein [Polyangiaceae bacterium]
MSVFRLFSADFAIKSRFGAVLRGLFAGGVGLLLGVVEPSSAAASSPFLVVPDPGVAELSPAYRYANMTDDEAFAELDKRQILYLREGPVHGVRAPIRLNGRLHGVLFRSALPPSLRATSMFEILDARLALTLDDFAALLAAHDIDEVVHYTMYRPNVARPGHDDHGGGVKRANLNKDADKKPAKAQPKAESKAEPKAEAKVEPKVEPKTEAKGNQSSKPAGKAISSKKSLSGKGLLDSSSKKGISKEKAPSASKEKSSAAITKAAKESKSTKPSGARKSPSPKAGISLRKAGMAPKSPVASVKSPVEAPRPRGTWAPPGTRHPAGLAIDVGLLRKRDGRWLSVADHFRGKIGEKTCGPGASVPENEDARELRAIVCEASELGLFTYVLTPNYNAAHADHYHMEIKPGVRWFLYH